MFYNLFTKYGYTDDTILYLQAEDIQYNARNIHKGRIYHTETEYFTMNNYYLSNISLQYILNIMYCNHEKMVDLDENTNLFIYMTGHGGDGFMKILDREFLHKDDLSCALSYLCQRLKNVVFFIDTCQATTQVNEEVLPKNCYVVCSSIKNESSISYKANRNVGCAVVDSLPKLFCEKLETYDSLYSYLDDILIDFDFDSLGSHVKFFGKSKTIKLSEFLTSEDELHEYKYL
ncbi:hypothetical protein BDAP_000770 [Binucleata daphniae]